VVAERLVLVVRALSSGDVGAAGDRTIPLPAKRVEQLGLAGLHRDVDGPGSEVVGPHGVTVQGRGLAHRHVILKVAATPLDVAQGAVAATIDEAPGLREIALLPGHARELRESDLDLGVAAHRSDAVVTENIAHE